MYPLLFFHYPENLFELLQIISLQEFDVSLLIFVEESQLCEEIFSYPVLINLDFE